jgi:hypothetical protein
MRVALARDKRPRVLPFDVDAARRYADLAVKARAAGKGFPTPDGYIAAIAAAKGFAVATRDTSAFDAAANVDGHRSLESRALTSCHRQRRWASRAGSNSDLAAKQTTRSPDRTTTPASRR